MNTTEIYKQEQFKRNYELWKRATKFSSTNNFDNVYFRRIVNMGIDAVPYITAELEVHPSQLVHALDLLFPDMVKYEGVISLKDACALWVSILKRQV
jgi:hypothetical protein